MSVYSGDAYWRAVTHVSRFGRFSRPALPHPNFPQSEPSPGLADALVIIFTCLEVLPPVVQKGHYNQQGKTYLRAEVQSSGGWDHCEVKSKEKISSF